MTIYNLIKNIGEIRKFIKENENNCDGTVELYEDHLSDLLEDLREKLVKVEQELILAKNRSDQFMIDVLSELRNQINGVLKK